jgi:hypothetical protein
MAREQEMQVVRERVSRTGKLSRFSDLSIFELWVGTIQSTLGAGGCGRETFVSATCPLQLAKASAAMLSQQKKTTRQMYSGEELIYPAFSVQW